MANSSAKQTVDVGTLIAETYRIEALVGRGGMGSVFLASHARLPGKQVAIKVLHADLQDAEVILRFKREAEITSRLGHPNIVGVHDFNVMPDGTPYLVLEYLQGESLASRLLQGPLPLETVFSIARQVGSALSAAHREGIVHRDLKPQNIFLVPTEIDGKLVEVAKVLDFGISKMRGSTTVKTQEATLLGTPQYMAPEQAKGDHANVDQRTDIFALGSIVYEMLAGHPAFSGENIPAVCFQVVYEEPRPLLQEAPSAPASVVASIAQAMSKVPDDRFSSISIFIEKLTGEKLPPLQSRTGISSPPRDGPRTGQEAFAQTMNSGDFGIAASTPRPRLPTPVPVDQPNPMGETVQSLAPPQVGESVSDRPAPVKAKRSMGPVIGIALASAAVGALVLYLVTRSPSTVSDAAQTPDAALVATGPPDAAVIVAPASPDAAIVAIVDAVIVDAVVVDAPAKVTDAAITRVAPDASRVAPPDPGGDETSGAGGGLLKQAMDALGRGDHNTAERLAGEVVVSFESNARQKARARSIRAIVQCVARFNEEQAGLDLKAIPAGFRGLRKQVLDRCHAAGYLKETLQ